MYWQQTLYRFNFNDHKVVNDQVHVIAAIQLDAFVENGKLNLPAKLDVGPGQLVTQAFLVSRLQQPGTQTAMDINCKADHALRNLVFSPRLCVSAVHASVPGRRLPVEQLLQNVVLAQPVRFRMEIQQNAVAQNGDEQRADVFVGNVVAALHQSAGLSAEHQELRSADAATVVHVLVDEVRRGFVTAARGTDQVDGVTRHRFADRHHAHQLLELEDLGGVGHGVGLRHVRGGGQIDHLHFFLGRQVVEHRVEEKPVELRFGQRICAFELDGILRGQHEERRGQFVIVAAHRAGQLLHGLQERRLRFGRRAVDLVGQQDVGEDGTFDERPGAVAGGGVFFDDVGAGDVGGHQVRGELNALEQQAQRLRERAHQQRLGGARQPGDQAVAAHEKPDHDLLEDFFLADNHTPNLADNLRFHFTEPRDAAFQFFRIQLRRG